MLKRCLMKGIYPFKSFSTFILIFIVINTIHSQELTVTYSNNPDASRIIRPIYHYPNIAYLSVNDFANIFNARTYFDDQHQKIIVYLDDKIIKITAFNPFILIDQQVYQLPAETRFENDQIYVPLHYFIDIMNKVLPGRIIYNRGNRQLEIITVKSNISNIAIEEKANGTLIKISTLRDFSASELGLRSSQGWLYVDLYGGKVDSSALQAEFNTGLVANILPSQVSDELAQIGFRLRDELVEKQLILPNPNEILVSVKTKKDLSKELADTLEREKRKWRIDKIVLDPGHGGKDPGAIGKYGTKEKDVVLSIAHYIKDMLEDELGIQVLMTREDDRFLELDQRTQFANRNQAKLFISIHANSNRNPKIHGISTYFLGSEKTDEARQVANLENSVISLENGNRYTDLSQESYILSAMAQNVYHVESQDLADIVQREMAHTCDLHDLGIFQAGFYVLWGASMPNILIETGFISNLNEEKLLCTDSFQKKQARAIFQSIKKFKEKYELEL